MESCLRFKEHRKIFKRIRDALKDESNRKYREEFEKALERLVESYDTRNHENRFVVGGALEVLFCALLKALGFECVWLREKRYDLQIDGRKFSLKGSFTRRRGTVHLINVLGDGEVKWDEPTLFFVGGYGVFYADPCMPLSPERKKDALTVKVRDVLEVSKDWKIDLKVPLKPEGTAHIRTASYDVAKSVLEQIGSTLLRKHLPEV